MARKRKDDADTLLARGQRLVDVDNVEAEAVLRRAVAAATTGRSRGACEDALGILKRRQNDNDAAMTFFRAAIESCKEDRHQHGLVYALVHLAGVELDTALREDAILHLREALEVAKGRDALEAYVVDILSYALESAGEHDEAKAMAERGFELLAKSGDERQLGISLGNQAVQLQIAGKMKEAERGYVRAIALSERAGDLHNAAMMSCNLGTLFVAQGRFRDAAPHIEKGMALHEKIGNRAGAAHAALAMADIRSAEGDSLGTIELQKKALAAFHAAGNRYLEGVALGNMGNEEMTIGRLELALKHHAEAIELLTAVRQEQSVATVLTNMALALAETGKEAEALDAAKRAVEIFRKAKDGRWEGIAFLSLGMVQVLSNREAARQSWDRALELLDKAQDPSQISRVLGCQIAVFGDRSLIERAKKEAEASGDREAVLFIEALEKRSDLPRGVTSRLLTKALAR
jgi:tetratricopeptide (TPR) repeat protein